MRIGATHLLEEHGSRLAVAEKLLEGKLDSFAQQFVSDIVDSTLLEAARIRIEQRQTTEKIVAATREKCAQACEAVGERFTTGALARMCAEACREVR